MNEPNQGSQGRARGRSRGRARDAEQMPPVRRPGDADAGPPGFPALPQPVAPPSAAVGALAAGVAQIAVGARAAPRLMPVAQPEVVLGRAATRPVPGAVAAGPGAGVGRGASRGRQERENIIFTRPSKDFDKKGNAGAVRKAKSNYFEVLKRPDWHLLQYRVDFTPDIDHTGVRKAMLKQLEAKIGKYIFDGTLLYCTKRLPEPFEEVGVRNSDPDNPIRINLRLVGEIQKDDQMYIVIMNIIFRRCLEMLNLTEMKRNYFDSEAGTLVKQHNLRIWPGYETSIRYHEDKLLLGCEIVFKVLRGDTAMDVMNRVYNQGGNFKVAYKAEMEGAVVMTVYNKRTYRIDDVDYTKDPTTKFLLRKEGKEVSYVEYYKTRYQVTVKNLTQPLLVSRPTRRDKNRGDDEPVFLIPELCGMTGLSEEMRKNYTVMKDVGEITRLRPDSRVQSLMRFNRRLADNEKIMTELNSWGLKFSPNLVEFDARVMNPQTIVQSGEYPAVNGDWSGSMRRQQFAKSAILSQWAVFFPTMMQGEVQQFIGLMQQCGRDMGFNIPPPKMINLQSDRGSDLTNRIRDECRTMSYNIVMVVMKSQRADTYGAIKKLTCCELGIPSQVVTGRILKGPASGKVRSIATKVMIQVASKLGSEPWRVKLPDQQWMVCGYDTYHDARQRKAVGAFVGSINQSFTRYCSSVEIHENNEEISAGFRKHLTNCLREYWKASPRKLPTTIIVYRDGIGASDIDRVKTIEIQALRDAIMDVSKFAKVEYKPKLAYIIVSKRISSRFFDVHGGAPANPAPGFVVDHTVTLHERFDFFLVSQSVTQGTVSPTSFNVVEDDTGLSPNVHQRLAYILTHLYYNWPGTLRVPAPCQYAHKLAYLVGESVNAVPNEQICTLPYYL